MSIFNLFKQLAFFFKIFSRKPKNVSTLLKNVIVVFIIDYILCHPFLNKLIEFNFNFYDEELVDIYISFIKSLSLLLNQNSI